MLLSNLSKVISVKNIYNFNKNKYFSAITSNSKFTNSKTLFVYDKNKSVKKIYLDEALKNKTPAIISNKYINNLKITQFVVSNINFETYSLLNKLHNNPPFKTLAVTGTNGKTSVVWYISKILNSLKYNNTTVGTLGHFKNGKKINDINLTTPAYEELFKYGSSNKREKNIYIFEASSHALEQNRLRNYPINIAAITNISKDHLDYHKTFSNYKKSKIKLFANHLENKGFAIINSRLKNLSELKKKLIKKNVQLKYFGNKSLKLLKIENVVYLNINNKKYKLGYFLSEEEIEDIIFSLRSKITELNSI